MASTINCPAKHLATLFGPNMTNSTAAADYICSYFSAASDRLIHTSNAMYLMIFYAYLVFAMLCAGSLLLFLNVYFPSSMGFGEEVLQPLPRKIGSQVKEDEHEKLTVIVEQTGDRIS